MFLPYAEPVNHQIVYLLHIRFCWTYISTLLNMDICSDPYVRIDLSTTNGDETIDSVLTKTKKRVS